MDQFEIKPPSPLKTLWVGILFISALVAGGWFSVKSLKSKTTNFIPKMSEQPQQTKSKILYRSIGNAPKQEKKKKSTNKSFKKPQYTIELKIVNSLYSANLILKKLSQRGIRGFYTPFQKNGKVYYRIRSGYFKSKKQAISSAAKIKQNGSLQVRVTTL